jgi:hypothetical protein
MSAQNISQSDTVGAMKNLSLTEGAFSADRFKTGLSFPATFSFPFLLVEQKKGIKYQSVQFLISFGEFFRMGIISQLKPTRA